MFDVFLCYNWTDDKTAWADALYVELRRLGVSVFKDDADIPFGDTLAPHLHDALLGSRMLVPLIGPSFHQSATCRLELLTALDHAYRLGAGTTERVMPVTWRVRPSALRPAQLKSARLVSREQHDVESQAALIAAKAARITTADDRRFGDVPALPRPEWFPRPLPANKRFHGRGETLWDLHDAFLVRDRPGNLGHPVVSVTGVGGQGKSVLCEQYARLFAQDHPGGVFLIRLGGSDHRVHADHRVLLSQFQLGLRAIGERLGLSGTDTADAAAIAGELAGRAPYLWIVDDVPPTLDERWLERLVAPTGNGRTLISTRGRLAKWASVEITLTPLDRPAGIRVLTDERSLPDDDPRAKEAAAGIVDDLNAHPLGLTIAAGLTSLPSFSGYPALRQELRRTTQDSLELAAHLADELPAGYAKPFSATLTRSFDQLTDAGRDLLAVTSVLGPAPIPLDLAGGVLARLGRTSVDQGLPTMSAHGLADDLGNDSYLTHALVARAARFRFPAAHLNRLRENACDLIGDSLEGNRGRFDLVRSTEPYLPHVLPLITNAEWPSGEKQWHMLNEAGRTRYELGDTAGALRSLEILNDRCANSAEVDEQTRVAALVSLGAAQFGQGNLTEALRLQRETVRRFEELSGPDHSDTLQAKENLANTLSALGDHGTARELLTGVYRARRAKGALTGRATLITMNNLVIAIGRCGDRALALRIALGAAALWYRAAGPDAPETLECVENAANNLLFLGRRDEAADTYGYLAERRRVVLGPDHPDTIDAEENLATALGTSYWPLYAKRLRVQGPLHPDVLNTLERLLRANLDGDGGREAFDPVHEEPAPVPVRNVRLDGEHAEWLADIVALAVRFEGQAAAHGPADPLALRAKIVLAHALAAADQYDGQIEIALTIAEDSRDGLEEAASRIPDGVGPDDLRIAEMIHHWILALQGEEPSYQGR
ncbi:tetratricopeptide repeat protein [Amycolatopsis sp. MEPSY49]|uniref:tetratricopeptide repeat protein n=1 Tax=Amycolatopsis sp. MEPSY49 TaxID=3151600 RepID=UPI003EF6B00A